MKHHPLHALLVGLLVAPVTAADPPVVAEGDQPVPATVTLIGDGLDGWAVDNGAREHHWRNVDGVIVGENEDEAGSVLWTEHEFSDFELTVEYRTPSEDYDSGVFARASSHQVQIGISRSLQRDMTACIYAPADGDGGYPGVPGDEAVIGDAHELGGWNTLVIRVEGDRIRTTLNGEAIVDYTAKTMPERGPIGLQLHQGVHMRMEFRRVTLRALVAGEVEAG